MSYSADIEKLNKLKSSLTDNKSSVDKVDLDGSWKGSAHDKQASNVKNLGSGVDSQISNIDSLITALTAADAYDEAKEEYDTALKNRNGLDSKASDYASAYKSYSDAMDAADKTMTEKQTAAEAAIGAIGDSYESSLSDVSTTDLKDTTFVVLSSAVSELAPDVVENKDTFNNGENIKAFIEKYDFKYYLLKTASPYMRTMIITLQNNDNYKLIYSDDKYILFEKNGTNNINAMPQRG